MLFGALLVGFAAPAQSASNSRASTSTQTTATAAASTSTQATATALAATSANATATAAASVKEGPLTVSFTGGLNATQTTQSYQGPTTITVSGTGQAAGKHTSDAFYIYTDENGNNVTPMHDANQHSLCINGKSVDAFVSAIPPYNQSHTYTFTFNALGGHLSFGVCDSNYSDNSGSFTIMFS